VHWRVIRDDGDYFVPGYDRTEGSAGTGSRSSGEYLSGDVAEAKGWDQGCS